MNGIQQRLINTVFASLSNWPPYRSISPALTSSRQQIEAFCTQFDAKMDEIETVDETRRGSVERSIGMDGTNFSKGPSKPVPLQPRPRSRPQSTPVSPDADVEAVTDLDRSSAPPKLLVDEVDSPVKEKKTSLSNFKKLFKKGKSEKKGTDDTITETDEKLKKI